MTTEIVGGQTRWSGGRDEEGHRTYKLGIQTKGALLDGPAAHLQTPGLPLPGSVWAYDNDLDVYAWCTGASDLVPREPKGNTFYDHTYTFTTKPRGSRHGKKDDRGARKKCADTTVQDPLAEPPKTSGGHVRNTEEFTLDKDGNRLVLTSFEPMTGAQAEFDRSRGQVTVEFNDVNLNLDVLDPLKDTVNSSTLWGLPARCWKLTEFHWDRKLYGSCFFYYTKRFVFESNCSVSPAAGLRFLDLDGTVVLYGANVTYSRWDHYVPDVSSLALWGKWDKTDPRNPTWVLNAAGADFTKPNAYDVIASPSAGGNVRRCLSRTVRGTPSTGVTDDNVFRVRVYPEADFLAKIPLLPATL